ncbi:hypothetical protein C2W62_53720, partial [Candidatus Entotheonella serta]
FQHDYEVVRPIILFGETAAERSRQTGIERTVVGDKARRFVTDDLREIERILERKFGYKTNHHTLKVFLAPYETPIQLELDLTTFS